MKTTKELLIQVRDLLAKGWIQGRMSDGDIDGDGATCFCILGAIGRVAHLEALKTVDQGTFSYMDWASTMRGCMKSAILRFIDGGFATIHGWNDAKGRTQAEVLTVVDKAIADVS